MPKRSLGQHLGIWDRLVAAAMNNIRDLTVARQAVEDLKQAVVEIRELSERQTALRAAAQQVTRDLEAAKERANRAAVRVNQGVMAAYGSKSEKLAEYGLRPWRPRRRKAVPDDPQAEPAAVPAAKKPRKLRRRRGS